MCFDVIETMKWGGLSNKSAPKWLQYWKLTASFLWKVLFTNTDMNVPRAQHYFEHEIWAYEWCSRSNESSHIVFSSSGWHISCQRIIFYRFAGYFPTSSCSSGTQALMYCSFFGVVCFQTECNKSLMVSYHKKQKYFYVEISLELNEKRNCDKICLVLFWC